MKTDSVVTDSAQLTADHELIRLSDSSGPGLQRLNDQ